VDSQEEFDKTDAVAGWPMGMPQALHRPASRYSTPSCHASIVSVDMDNLPVSSSNPRLTTCLLVPAKRGSEQV
jgi:hypothetical protein